MTLKDLLQDWVDFDIAQHQLAVVLGFLEPGDEAFREHKWIYWSDNPLTKKYFDILKSLVEMGCLLYDEQEQKVKWNNDYSIDRLKKH